MELTDMYIILTAVIKKYKNDSVVEGNPYVDKT